MRKFFPLLFLLLLLTGCLSPEQQVVGKWKGKLDINKGITSSMGPMGGMANLIQPQLDLRPDKTFRLSISLAPVEGTWKLEGNQLLLTPTSFMGMPTSEVKAQAQKQLDHARTKASGMPFPIPTEVPGISEMKADVDLQNHKMTLDPASGTAAGGLGKIVFTKV